MTAQLSRDSPLLGAACMASNRFGITDLRALRALTRRKKRYFFEPVLLREPVL
jgi:hypothetical protein